MAASNQSMPHDYLVPPVAVYNQYTLKNPSALLLHAKWSKYIYIDKKWITKTKPSSIEKQYKKYYLYLENIGHKNAQSGYLRGNWLLDTQNTV